MTNETRRRGGKRHERDVDASGRRLRPVTNAELLSVLEDVQEAVGGISDRLKAIEKAIKAAADQKRP